MDLANGLKYEKEKEAVTVEANDEPEEDPWNVAALKDSGKPWSELTTRERVFRVLFAWILKPMLLLGLLYLFVCSLSFLGSAFQLLGGKSAGEAFSQNEIVSNPIAGLMIGILGTVLLQSSSTTTSIVVTMVSAEILDVKTAIPIVMGANIGTSVTNTIVSLGHAKERDEFRRAFAGATVHDMFNFLSVLILLPLELASGYLFRLSEALVDAFDLDNVSGKKQDLLKKITKPLTGKVVQLDKKLIQKIAKGEDDTSKSLIKVYCNTVEAVNSNATVCTNGTSILGTYQVWENNTLVAKNYTDCNSTVEISNVTWLIQTQPEQKLECDFLFHNTSLSDSSVGTILLIIALIILCVCLVLIVKTLHSLLRGRVAYIVKKTINADFPKPFAWFTGYVAIAVGAGVTMLVQSSSIFTSAITPLVGVGVITLERTYPLTLGANIGTTVTGILAALASSGSLRNALQIAMCHLFFNISGILIWYPIPKTRKIPIGLARILGNTTADYRWFPFLYIIVVFFLIPAILFALSMAGWYVLLAIGGPIFILSVFIVTVNVLQRKKPQWLPEKLKTWDWLPLWMHSLDPLDKVMVILINAVKKLFGFCCCKKDEVNETMPATMNKTMPATNSSVIANGKGFEMVDMTI